MRENPSKQMWLLLTLGSAVWFIRWRIKQAEYALLSAADKATPEQRAEWADQARAEAKSAGRAAITADYFQDHGGALPGLEQHRPRTEAEVETAQINAYLDAVGGEGTGESILAAFGGDW